ncbi:MAG: hypothetical protein M3R63_08600 [Actinomycetota bacterium]|nr:hypothetical protein [Actinomycetota bacterium]
MSTAARFDVAHVEVAPGAASTCVLTVANRSPVVEAYQLRPVGSLAPFTRLEPDRFSLYPDSETEVVVTLSVPRTSQVLAGDTPFAVFVQPTEDPEATAVPETVVAVDGFIEIDTELFPRTSQGRRADRHSLAVDNLGNHPLRVGLSGEDLDDHLAVRCRPDVLVIGPGETAFASVGVRARRLMWKGAPQTRPFRVELDLRHAGDGVLGEFAAQETPDEIVHSVDGRFVQLGLLPRATGKLAALVAMAAVAMLVLWFALLRPTIRTAAQDAVAEPVQAVQAQAMAAQEQAGAAQKDAAAASEDVTAATVDTPEEAAAQAQKDATVVQEAARVPFTQRLAVAALPNETETETFVVPEDLIIEITDLVFESRGDMGRVRLLRDEDELITLQAENFRTLDQHFVSPITFTEGEEIVYEVACAAPVAPAPTCDTALLLNGTSKPEPPPPPAPVAPAPPVELPPG